MKQPINILVDHREKSEAVRQALESKEAVTVKTWQLPMGDYQAGERILFERKTRHDFAVLVIYDPQSAYGT